jgi:hypothetical protein
MWIRVEVTNRFVAVRNWEMIRIQFPHDLEMSNANSRDSCDTFVSAYCTSFHCWLFGLSRPSILRILSMRLPILPLFPGGGMPPAGTLKFMAGSHKFGKRCGQWLTYRATFGGVRTTSSSSPSTPNLYGVSSQLPSYPGS